MPRVALSGSEIEAFRGRIYQAATHLFAHEGFDAVTLRGIARQVGCSPMTPYRYFSGKEEIFALVKAGVFSRFADVQERAMRGALEPIERLWALGRAYVQFALDDPDGYRIMFELRQQVADHPELAQQSERAWLPLRNGVAEAIEARVLVGEADTLAHIFWAGMHGLVSLHLAGKLQVGRTLDDLLDPLMATVLAGADAQRNQKEESR